jgi:putative phosphoesterase
MVSRAEAAAKRHRDSVDAYTDTMLVGVIADTHGYVDPRLAAVFAPRQGAGVEAIVHAGDVGGAHVLDALRSIAPLYAVYGNNDEKLGGLGLRLHEDFVLAGVRFHLVHQLPHATPELDTRVVVFGHSHRAVVEHRDGRLYVNPGAAGRTGFHRVQTVALLRLDANAIDARIVELGTRETIGRSTRRRRDSR